MTIKEVAQYRMFSQKLATVSSLAPAEIVKHMGAIQAQDYGMSKWAVGIRTAKGEHIIEQAINRGEIIRTHVLRPTWHMVHAADIRWLLQLTAPQIRRFYASTARLQGLDEKLLMRYGQQIGLLLEGNNYRTRADIMQLLCIDKQGVGDLRSSIIMMHAELEGIVCNGPMSGKQFTYGLMDEIVPKTVDFVREEALLRLVSIYFSSHGPATVADFSWWSGLSQNDCKAGVAAIKHELGRAVVDGKEYWYKKGLEDEQMPECVVGFLPAFDEFLISYKDRTAAISLEHQPRAFTRNGIFRPVVVVDGQVVGTWTRTISKGSVIIDPEFFTQPQKSIKEAIFKAAARYGEFSQLETLVNFKSGI